MEIWESDDDISRRKNFSNYAEELNGGVPIKYCNIKYPDGTNGAYYDGMIRFI